MPKIKEQKQTPTFEEFMKTYNESENLNYDDLNTNTKSYGPGGPGGDDWWYGRSREFLSTLKQCDSCSRTITGEEYSRNGGYCNSHKNRCQFEEIYCPERVNSGYCYKHTFEEQVKFYKAKWRSEESKVNNLQNELRNRPTAQQLYEANGKISGLQSELGNVSRERDNRPNITLYQWNNDYSQRPTRQQYDNLVRERNDLRTQRNDLQGRLNTANANLTAANNRAGNLQTQLTDLNNRLTLKRQEIEWLKNQSKTHMGNREYECKIEFNYPPQYKNNY